MTLAILWFVLVTVLWVGFLVLDGFDLGVGMLHGALGRDEAGRRSMIATITPVWDGNEVWLIVAAGATFAAFPPWFATMFSALYLPFFVLLVALIARGVSFEFRARSATARSRRFWDGAMTGGSVAIPLIIGIGLGNLLRGVPIGADQEFVGTLFDVLTPYALLTGLVLVLLCLLHGAAYAGLKTAGELRERAVPFARRLAAVGAVAVLGFGVWTAILAGQGGTAWLAWVLAGVAVLGVLAANVALRGGRDGRAFAATAVTIAGTVGSLFAGLYPRVMVSTLGPANDLTVAGTASSQYALTVITVVAAVLLPIVLAYQGWSLHVFRRRVGANTAPAATAAAESRRETS